MALTKEQLIAAAEAAACWPKGASGDEWLSEGTEQLTGAIDLIRKDESILRRA